MKPLKVRVATFLCILLLLTFLKTDSISIKEFDDYQFVKKDAQGISLYVYKPEINKLKKTEQTDRRMIWADAWFINRVQDGLNQSIPYQANDGNLQKISKTFESSHDWGLSLLCDLLDVGYNYTATNALTIEEEISKLKTYGPINVKPGYKCRLVSYAVMNTEEGVFQGDLYKKERSGFTDNWVLAEKNGQFGSWKITVETIYYEFEHIALEKSAEK